MILIAAALLTLGGAQPPIAQKVRIIAHLDCKVLLREGETVDLKADFDQTARTIRFQSDDARLPLGDKAISLRFYETQRHYEGSVAFGKEWLNFQTASISRMNKITQIEFRLESMPPMEAMVQVDSLYGVAICNVKHSETQS